MAALIAGLSNVACDSSDRIATDILRRTIPPGDSSPLLSRPTWSGQSVRFTWEFETGVGPGYADWLVQHLHEFRVFERDASHLWLSKYVEGEAYTLRIALEPMIQRTYVRVTLTASPD